MLPVKQYIKETNDIIQSAAIPSSKSSVGGFSEVIPCMWNNKRVVMKTINRQFVFSFEGDDYFQKRALSQGMEKLEREVEILESLPKHKNIIEILDKVKFSDSRFSAILFEEGVPMGFYLCNRHGITEGEQTDLLIGLFEGIMHLHKNGLLHSDIRLDNIVITPDGCLKIIDFGSSCWESSAGSATPETDLEGAMNIISKIKDLLSPKLGVKIEEILNSVSLDQPADAQIDSILNNLSTFRSTV